MRLSPDPTRVIARPFIPGGESRVTAIVDRVLAMTDATVTSLLDGLLDSYAGRHRDLEGIFAKHFDQVGHSLNGQTPVSRQRRLLIGAYFTMEYSLESVALFNPSLVLHPDQSGLAADEARVIMSLRACGEGHISSIEFRTGLIDASGVLTMDGPTGHALCERPVDNKLYDKARFRRKLIEMSAYNPLADGILDQLDTAFTSENLTQAIDTFKPQKGFADTLAELTDVMRWLVRSTYHLKFPPSSRLDERVIFPVTENESRGIEDARFVRFTDDDGGVVYYATFTAYNGFKTLPQFLETTDFCFFKIYTLNGQCVQNKGQALFPRKIRGEYWMVSRLDGENIYLLRSDNIHFWNDARRIRTPMQPWEFIQIGNCGSPIETEAGWLVMTHGVGPMRQYWLGAILLDLDDPSRVIGHLEEPVLFPDESERNGYVPNVLYSCGSLRHGNRLFIPYGAADTSTNVATLALDELMASFRRSAPH